MTTTMTSLTVILVARKLPLLHLWHVDNTKLVTTVKISKNNVGGYRTVFEVLGHRLTTTLK